MPAVWSKIIRSALLLAAVATSLTTAVAQTATNVIFPVTQIWSYIPTPNDTTFCLTGTGWEQPGYDDSVWLTGPGGFTGGAGGDIVSRWPFGLLNTTSLPAPTPSSGRPQYFRTHFNIASTNDLTWLVLSNLIDDQAVFYLNGTRVADYHHPNNPESCTPGGAGDDATVWVVITLYPSNWVGVLHPGDNVLAVSVHQNAATSPYMIFVSLLSSVTGTIVIPPPIIFGNNGAPMITFDTAPPPQQWSTFTWSGAATSITNFNGLDAAARTNNASLITASLNSGTGDPPTTSTVGIWSSAGFICTRPAGVAYSGIMATLSNATASAINSFGIRYSFHVTNSIAHFLGSEQIPGQLVYYSIVGTPGSWVQIPELSDSINDEIDGDYAKSADVTLGSPWNAGAKLYILWVDDNASPLSPDDSCQIDNVAFCPLSPVTLVFVNDTGMTNRTVAQCESTTFSAGSAIGTPCSPTFALGYQWYKTDVSHPNGGAIRGATNTSYTIANVQPADAGVYFVRAAGIEAFGESSHATLTVTPAPTFAMMKAVASTNRTNIVVSFNLPVDPASVDPNGSDIDVRETGGGLSLGVVSASVLNGTNVLVVAASPMAAGVSYEVEFQNAGVGNTCTTNNISGNFPVTSRIVIQVDPSFQRADLIWPTGVLQWNTNLSRGIGWTDVPGSGNAGSATSPYTVYWAPARSNGTNEVYFRLRFSQ